MSKFDESYKAIRDAGGDAWDKVEDVERELKIIRGQPIEWAEAAIKQFEKIKAHCSGEGGVVAGLAINKFRELLK